MNKAMKVVLPLLILLGGALGGFAIISAKPEVKTQPADAPAPVVRTVTVEPVTHRFTVRAQGSVEPRIASTLVAEVSGRVTSTADAFVSGGFFKKNEVLLTIDSSDYEAALARAEAELTAAQLSLAREQEEAVVAEREWKRLDSGEEPSTLVKREPQLANARALVAAARAAVEKSRRDLARTRIRAPYDGRVRQKQVDLGGYVRAGSPVGNVYAVDAAEIRLPLPDADLAYLDLSFSYRNDSTPSQNATTVLVHATFGGRSHTWRGVLDRTEGEIDARTRMVNVVARVDDPYGRGDNPERPPLAAGMFVEAEILGREVNQVYLVPRDALRDDTTVLVVDNDNTLRFRRVEVLRRGSTTVVIASGLRPGERICISRLETVVEGMRVRVAGGETS